MSKVVIIGAGIGGLATANLLAAAGHEVAVYEQNAMPGGRAGLLQIDGFTFDTGPSWYLMPGVFEHYFALLGESVHDYLQLKRLDPAYKVFYENSSEVPAAAVEIYADLARDRQTFEAIEVGAGHKLERYVGRSASVYQAAIKHFLYTNFQNKPAMLRPDVLRQLPLLARLSATPIDRYVRSYFRNSRLQQIMEYPMVFLGSSPFEAPAIYSLMSHMDFTQGVFYPQGGMYTIIEALVSIGRKHGVDYHYGSPVTAIRSLAGMAAGITLADGSEIAADIVISNADLHFTETQLVQPAEQTYPAAYWDDKQPGPSALLLYLGVRGQLPQLTHHNLLFAEAWRANFDAIFKHKTWPAPASIYICKPSHSDTAVAPDGHENLFVLVPAPAGVETSEAQLASLADSYLDQIATMINVPDLKQRIVVKHVAGPQYFQESFHSWQGSALGLSHRLSQSALFRPANRSKKIKNLYYVGANTTPGIGLPMCLIGAELVYKRLIGDTSSGPLAEPISGVGRA